MKRKRLTRKQLRAIFAKQRYGNYVVIVKGKRNIEVSDVMTQERAEQFAEHQKKVVHQGVDVYVDQL